MDKTQHNKKHRFEEPPNTPYWWMKYAFTVNYSSAINFCAQYRAGEERFAIVTTYDRYGNPEWAHFFDTSE